MVNGNNVSKFCEYWQGKDIGREKVLQQAYDRTFKEADDNHTRIIDRLDFKREEDGSVVPCFSDPEVLGLVDNYEGAKRKFQEVEKAIVEFLVATEGEFTLEKITGSIHRAQNRIDSANWEKKILLIQAVKGSQPSEKVAEIISKNDQVIEECTPVAEAGRKKLAVATDILSRYG